MIYIGEDNRLKALRKTKIGFFLGDDEGTEILLPIKYCPEDLEVDEEIDVFVYKDNEGRPIATTLEANAIVGEFAYMKVNQVNQIGAFMEWGIDKDLLVPYRNQKEKLEVGKSYPIYVYLDEKSERIVGTNKINHYFEYDKVEAEVNQEVSLLVYSASDIGFQVVVDNLHKGMIFKDEVFQHIKLGDKLKGYVKQVRPDGKLDIALQKQGYEHVEPNANKILGLLRTTGGFLPLHDKSNPEEIKTRLAMSKKTFKKAIGALYKEKLIKIEDNGIRLL